MNDFVSTEKIGTVDNASMDKLAPRADLTEARRLHDAGLSLVKLHHLTKRPIGEQWNQHAAKQIDDNATGYGLPLVKNGLCSIDPDHVEMARVVVKSWGFDLEELMTQGVRTESTREHSGGRAAFAADEHDMCRWLTFKVFDQDGNAVTVLELRAKSENLQDCVPGVVYTDRTTGELCSQQYANEHRFDAPPPLPDGFARLWRMMSGDDDKLREYDRKAFEALQAAGFTVHDKTIKHLPQMGNGQNLAFPAPGIRGPYNSAHTVNDILDRHGYEWHVKEGRYSRPGAIGAPGVRPIPGKDGLWRSDHGGDPLHGTFDAWAAHVQLDHSGDVTTAIAEAKQQQAEDESKETAGRFDLSAASVGDLLRTPPPPRQWLVRDRLPLNVVGMLAAAGGTGKSMNALQLAVSICTGLPWLDMEIENTGKVLIFSAEDDRDETHRRLHTVAEHYATLVDPFDPEAFEPYREKIAENLFVFDCVGMDNRLTAKVDRETVRTEMAQVVTQVADEAQGVALIILDPLARFDGGDPNDNADSTRLIECAEQIRKDTGATVLLPHHVNKSSMRDPGSGQEAVRGGSGLVDGARWVGLLRNMGEQEAGLYGLKWKEGEARALVSFTTPKANYSAPWDGLWLRRIAGGVLVPTELKESKTEEKERKADQEHRDIVRRVIELIENKGPMARRRIEDNYGGTTGVLKASQRKVRGSIIRAIEEGHLITTTDPETRADLVTLPAGNLATVGAV